MENALTIALSNQLSLRRHVDVIANNVANSSTPAFKGESMMFAEHLVTTDDGQELSFVEDVGTALDFAPGELTQTGNPYDLGIDGDGWFVVETPDGERYTRNGRFKVDAEGQLITGHGYPVIAKGGQKIVLGPEDRAFEVTADGTIRTESGTWQLQIVEFENQQALLKVSGGLFQTEATPTDAKGSQVIQGVLEESNIAPILEISKMIWSLRRYQSTQRFIETEQELQRAAIQKITADS